MPLFFYTITQKSHVTAPKKTQITPTSLFLIECPKDFETANIKMTLCQFLIDNPLKRHEGKHQP